MHVNMQACLFQRQFDLSFLYKEFFELSYTFTSYYLLPLIHGSVENLLNSKVNLEATTPQVINYIS